MAIAQRLVKMLRFNERSRDELARCPVCGNSDPRITIHDMGVINDTCEIESD